jgi:hypothetical protein
VLAENTKKSKENEPCEDFHIFPIDRAFSIHHNPAMQIQRELERRIERKRQEIADLKQQLNTAESYLAALQDTLKLLPKEGDKEVVLRAGSDLARARDFIKAQGRPLHVTDILKGIGKEVNKPNKISLSGSLGGYVRRGVIFTKPAPNTFGLIELESTEVKLEVDPVVVLESVEESTY